MQKVFENANDSTTSTAVVEKVQELAMKGVKADQRECLIDNEPM